MFFAIPDSAAARRLWRVNRVYWLTVLYAGVWVVLRAAGLGGYPPLPLPSQVAIGVVFLIAVTSLALRTRAALRRGGYGRVDPSRIGWVFTALDLMALTAAIRLTGGIVSGLWPILFVIVVAETVLEPTREAWFIRIGAAFALTVACVPWPLRSGFYLLDLATRLLFLMAVTSVARRLREGSDREKSEVAALRAELAMTEERSQLSREVHDGVGNTLAAAVLHLEVAAREQERSQSSLPLPALLREEAQTLRQAMNAVRDWTYWTRPWSVAGLRSDSGASASPALDGGARLTEEIARFSRRTGLPIRLSGEALLDDLRLLKPDAAALRLTIFRITQEALTNVAKHAVGATGAAVTLRREAASVVLQITDDGSGFGTLPSGAGSGIGVASMRERAESMGGTLIICASSAVSVSAVGEDGEMQESGDERPGATIIARLPLP